MTLCFLAGEPANCQSLTASSNHYKIQLPIPSVIEPIMSPYVFGSRMEST